MNGDPVNGTALPGAGETGEAAEPVVNIDWSLAASLGRRLARPGPRVTRYTMEQCREELAQAAVRAEGPVREVTGLADGLAVPAAQVLDRAGWIGAAAESMPAMIGDSGTAGSGAAGAESGRGVAAGFGAKLGGVQAGGLLAFLSAAILGQYDPFSPDPVSGEQGVLMLVAPNIIAVERQLRVVPSDFRYWVCLHEVTHRVQFSSNPWLTGYMRDNVAKVTDTGDSASDLIARITEGLRSPKPRQKGMLGVMELLQSPEQHDAFERLLVLGTLLEGHADHVMDAVGPTQVPTVAQIRSAFDHRRKAPRNPLQRIIRALIGMDAKMEQYIRGKAFVDAVVGEVGMARFNTVWSSPETMPLMAEIGEPQKWIDRVL